MSAEVDAVIVGAGPNGLAAAVTLARAGLSVAVFERSPRIGGGAATAELTLPGFHHDVCSAVHPLAFESAFFQRFALTERVDFVTPETSFAHPLDGGRAAIAYRDLARTREALGADGRAYEKLIGPLAARAGEVAEFTGSTLLRIPRHPTTAARFALRTLEQGSPAWNLRFTGEDAAALLTGVTAHSILSQPSLAAAASGLVLAAYAHARGWPIPVGGSQAMMDAMAADLRAHGGTITTGVDVTDLDALPPSRVVILDVTPRALVRLAGDRMPGRYRRTLEGFRYGGAVAKVDFALSAPVPWANEGVRAAGTVHVGGTRAEIVAAERDVHRGRMPEQPYVLAAQQSLFDASRAPAGAHTLWTYTHVPAGSTVDRREAVVRQIERFAPGFRDTILAVNSRTAVDVAHHNPNYPGGDIAAGAPTLRQLIRRPTLSAEPWRTPIPGVYLASASVSPGPGVHGLAGWRAALTALRRDFAIHTEPTLSP